MTTSSSIRVNPIGSEYFSPFRMVSKRIVLPVAEVVNILVEKADKKLLFCRRAGFDASRVRENWFLAAFTVGGNDARAAGARQPANSAGCSALLAAAGSEAAARAGTCAKMGLATTARAVGGLSPVKVPGSPGPKAGGAQSVSTFS
jgi:hypothetical protein